MGFMRKLSRGVWPFAWKMRRLLKSKFRVHSGSASKTISQFVRTERIAHSKANHPTSSRAARIRWEESR